MMGGVRGGGEGEEAEDQAGSDEDVPGRENPMKQLGAGTHLLNRYRPIF